MKISMILFAFVSIFYFSGAIHAQETEDALKKRQTRIFKYDASQVRDAILTWHRDRGDRCSDSSNQISCRIKSGLYEGHYRYFINERGGETEVRLVTPDPTAMADDATVTNFFRRIERQLLKEETSAPPEDAGSREPSGLAKLIKPFTSSKEELETRKFNFPVAAVRAAFRDYFIYQIACRDSGDTTSLGESYRCPEKTIFGYSQNKRNLIILEYRVRGETETDVRIRSEDVSWTNFQGEAFKIVLQRLESTRTATTSSPPKSKASESNVSQTAVESSSRGAAQLDPKDFEELFDKEIIRKGLSQSEVEAILGKPLHVRRTANGMTTWIYDGSTPSNRAESSTPQLSAASYYAMIIFNGDGVVTQIARRGRGSPASRTP